MNNWLTSLVRLRLLKRALIGQLTTMFMMIMCTGQGTTLPLIPVLKKCKFEMLDSEVSWTEQAQLVAQLEEEECSLANQAEEKSFMINRVRLMRTGDESQLDSAVKKSFQVRKVQKRHFKCNENCITSKFDHNPPTVTCSSCSLSCHVICLSSVEVEDQTLCFSCANFNVGQRLQQKVEDEEKQKKLLLQDMRSVNSNLTREKYELARRREVVDHFVGPHEREFERILEEDLKVNRQEFASGHPLLQTISTGLGGARKKC